MKFHRSTAVHYGRAFAAAFAAISLASGVAGCGGSSRTSGDQPVKLKNAMALRTALEAGAGNAQKEEVKLADPTGWGTFKGKFKVAGQVASLPPLNADKDQAVCAPGGKQPPNESIVVGANGELKNVLVYLTTKIPLDDPKWIHEQYDLAAHPELAETIFDQKSCVFLSHVFGMRATQKAKILNSDSVLHNSNIAALDNAKPINSSISANGFIYYEPGGSSRQPFSVTCSVHPWMTAHMIVRDDPYFAVTGADGSFEIKNLPAGVELEFRIWHERAKIEQVTVNGSATKWSKGRMKLTLAPDQSESLDVAIDAGAF